MSDLTITGALVLDPKSGVNGPKDIAICGGRIAGAPSKNAPEFEADGLIAVPGLIDLHTHVYVGGTSLGVDPDAYLRSAGVTTCVDAGSAGPGNFAGFRDHVITGAQARILAFLHVSHAGIFGFAEGVAVGESEDMRLMAPAEAVRVARENPELVIGIKVRVGRHASGDQGVAPLEIALQVAEEAGLPLMAHIDEPPPSYEAVLRRLRPTDILTHAFRPFPNSPMVRGKPVSNLLEPQADRPILDVGHGMGSFSFAIARQMLEQRMPPDVISSDVHALCINGPAFDLPTTMNKFLALGMPLEKVVQAATTAPARAIGRDDLGHLGSGAAGDVTLLAWEEGAFSLTDTAGESITAERRLAVRGVVRNGCVVAP